MTVPNRNDAPSMRRLGILGGMSWASSIKYYDIVNREVLRLTRGAHAADLVMWSFDTTEIEPLIAIDNWKLIGAKLQNAADKLASCEVDGLIIASNTIHRVVEQSLISTRIPLLHIRDALIDELRSLGSMRVGFVGTSATMRGSVYRNIVSDKGPVEVILPEQGSWADIDEAIFARLCRGVVSDRDVALMSSLMDGFLDDGVDAVVLGCTELGMLCFEESHLRILDTTTLHAQYAAKWSASDFLTTTARESRVAI